jgi:TatD DNase family protein
MRYIETHAHIYLEHFEKDIDEIISRSHESGVKKIYMPNIDHESIDGMLELEEKYPETCIATMGLHPCSVKKDFEKQLYEVEDWLNKRKFVAVGEMGTDLYWDKTGYEYQVEAFKIQCQLAIQHQIPVIIHCRDSLRETIDLVKEINNPDLKGVFHCFGGAKEEAKEIIDLGFYLGIGGVLTFKNSGLKDEIPEIDLNKIVLETDSPYLTPVPHRGKRNEPSYIPLVAQKLVEITGKSADEIATITSKNALTLFQADEL